MSTYSVAKKLIRFCRERRHRKAVEELYADHCISREMPGVPDEFLTGKPALLEKNQKWFELVEVIHEFDVSDPVIAGDFFCCQMTSDITFKGHKRMQLDELCVYEVQDGLIVSEQFFYSASE